MKRLISRRGLTRRGHTKITPSAGSEAQPCAEHAQLNELLRRGRIRLDTQRADEFLSGKRVMVTGGGGSIGSELCRQIAAHCPEKLIILDFNENNACGICEELKSSQSETDVAIAIASVRDKVRMEELFERQRPDIVIHAAAHKHLPLMEEAPGEAIKNNVAGTAITADLAGRCGCETFVFISTDKAVNPTCAMGRTKRVGEQVTAAMARRYHETRFVSVRFGNVLGSAGSVLPIFKQQIEMGGPIRVTHPEVTRYFMTIPEAAQLVLTAGAMAEGGEIFVLDMGEPVRILDLAENLVRMSGLEPYRDIAVVFTGLRPGEKLHEELITDGEAVLRTAHPRVRIAACRQIYAEPFLLRVDRLCALAESGQTDKAVGMLRDLCAFDAPGVLALPDRRAATGQ